MGDREGHLVELLDEAGSGVGSATVAEAHRAPGRLHRAFSVVVMDAGDRVLLQRRAAVKTRFALRWANTCCGHPAPGEDVLSAAARRLHEEIGIGGLGLREVGVVVYEATDPATGLVEREWDHVVVGRVRAGEALPVTAPDPAEVAEVSWRPLADLAAAVSAEPHAYAPWLAHVLTVLPASHPATREFAGS